MPSDSWTHSYSSMLYPHPPPPQTYMHNVTVYLGQFFLIFFTGFLPFSNNEYRQIPPVFTYVYKSEIIFIPLDLFIIYIVQSYGEYMHWNFMLICTNRCIFLTTIKQLYYSRLHGGGLRAWCPLLGPVFTAQHSGAQHCPAQSDKSIQAVPRGWRN